MLYCEQGSRKSVSEGNLTSLTACRVLIPYSRTLLAGDSFLCRTLHCCKAFQELCHRICPNILPTLTPPPSLSACGPGLSREHGRACSPRPGGVRQEPLSSALGDYHFVQHVCCSSTPQAPTSWLQLFRVPTNVLCSPANYVLRIRRPDSGTTD